MCFCYRKPFYFFPFRLFFRSRDDSLGLEWTTALLRWKFLTLSVRPSEQHAWRTLFPHMWPLNCTNVEKIPIFFYCRRNKQNHNRLRVCWNICCQTHEFWNLIDKARKDVVNFKMIWQRWITTYSEHTKINLTNLLFIVIFMIIVIKENKK
jgi:hypothetical protein